MPVPDFQSLMLPVLEVLGEGGELSSAAIRGQVADKLKLTDADRSELLPSGHQPRLNNRVAWATIYLTEAGCATWIRRGIYRISEQGRSVLNAGPDRIDLKFLAQFPKFNEWRSRESSANGGGKDAGSSATTAAATPEEQIGAGYEALRHKVEGELLEKILAASPKFFEDLVVEVLVKMGYGGSREDAGRALGQSGDGGVDGIIKEDKLGLDAIYVQAKRWQPSKAVGRPDVQAFAGSLEGERARKGVFITTSSFSREAEEYVRRIEKKIVLIGGKALVALMFDNGVGVRTKVAYEIKEVDEDYFAEE